MQIEVERQEFWGDVINYDKFPAPSSDLRLFRLLEPCQFPSSTECHYH